MSLMAGGGCYICVYVAVAEAEGQCGTTSDFGVQAAGKCSNENKRKSQAIK
jgi:hypothetical protein